MKKPLVSILLPIATKSPFLSETLESLTSQDYKNFEFILVINKNDNHLVEQFSLVLEDFIVKIVRVESTYNLSQRLNEGIRYCSGTYIARADADDCYPTNRISSQLNYLESADLNLAIVSGQGNLIDKHGFVFGRISVPTALKRVESRLVLKNCLIHPAVMMRTDAVKEFGYDIRLKTGEDYELWLRMGTKYQMANLDLVVINYRVHDGNLSKTRLPSFVVALIAKRKWDYGNSREFSLIWMFISISSWTLKNLFFGPQFVTQLRRKLTHFKKYFRGCFAIVCARVHSVFGENMNRS
jgi:glycosyltransferase involved in cell wall biosynthesis